MSWSPAPSLPDAPIRLGWSPDGPAQPAVDPRFGWGFVRQVTATGSSLGLDLASINSRLIVRDSGVAGDTSVVAVSTSVAAGAIGGDQSSVSIYLPVSTTTGGGGDAARLGIAVRDAAAGSDSIASRPRLSPRDSGVAAGTALSRQIFSVRDAGAAAGSASAGFGATSPVSVTYSSVGTFTFTIPVGCRYIDIVLLGGGASGETGSGAVGTAGKGGPAGSWYSLTLERGVDIPWTLITFTITVGAGGAQPANSDLDGPNAGAATTSSVNGITYTASPGSGSMPNQDGGSPGSHSRSGITYSGGVGGTGNAGAATAPGAGGAGGNGGIFGSRTRGAAGSPGRGWVRAYQ